MISFSVCLLLVMVTANVQAQPQIAWNENWAMGCDFRGNDLANVRVRGEDCGPRCDDTAGCTHFTWTNFNGGTCWMKKGPVAKGDAVAADRGTVCGIANSKVKWNGNWAFGCDFKGRDIGNARTNGEQCGGTCASKSGCTHFTWTNFNGGTCWMKTGNAIKSDCYRTGNPGMICGIADGNPPPPPPGHFVNFKFVNKMSQTIWVGLQGRSRGDANWKLPYNGGFALSAGQTIDANFPRDLNAARFWGRSGCRKENGRFRCETGDCGPFESCASGGVQRGGVTPATLAEFTLNGSGNQDFYDISLVDGYNLPMTIIPTNPSSGNNYWCKNAGCTSDLNRSCPGNLQKKNSNGQVVGCLSACERFNTDFYCCRGANNQPSTCKPNTWPYNYAAVFKSACPAAYSYAYDDETSTFFCRNTNYIIQFG